MDICQWHGFYRRMYDPYGFEVYHKESTVLSRCHYTFIDLAPFLSENYWLTPLLDDVYLFIDNFYLFL